MTTELDHLVVRISADLGEFRAGLAAVGTEIAENLEKPALAANAVISEAFGSAFGEIAAAIEGALVKGRFSVGELVGAILGDLQRLAVGEFIAAPLRAALGGLAGSLFGGARALGGPVMPGRAYLVGERGPELFVPKGAGAIAPRAGPLAPAASITVNIATPDPVALARSQGQVTAMLLRALERSQRML